MCRMLLSIKPEYVESIISGEKKYEYRRVKCRESIDRILIYATSPISQIVAEVEVLGIIVNSPSEVWRETKDYSGITSNFFYEYFYGKEKAIAYRLGAVYTFEKPKCLEEYGIYTAPQSFVYIA